MQRILGRAIARIKLRTQPSTDLWTKLRAKPRADLRTDLRAGRWTAQPITDRQKYRYPTDRQTHLGVEGPIHKAAHERGSATHGAHWAAMGARRRVDLWANLWANLWPSDRAKPGTEHRPDL